MKKLILSFLIFLSAAFISGEIAVDYAKIDELNRGDDFSMYAKINKGYESISDIYVVIRGVSGGQERRFIMEKEEGRAFIIIPSDSLPEESFSYFFEIYLKNSTFLTYPENASQRQENRVVFKDPYYIEKNEIYLFSPENPDNVSELKPLIAICSGQPLKDRIILLDGANITKDCIYSSRITSYVPPKNLAAGRHRIDVISGGILMGTFYINIGASDVISRMLSGEAAFTAGTAGKSFRGNSSCGVYADIDADIGGPCLNMRVSAPRMNDLADFRYNRYLLNFNSGLFKISAGSFRFGNESELIGRIFPFGGSFGFSPGIFRLNASYGFLRPEDSGEENEVFASASAGAEMPLASAALSLFSVSGKVFSVERISIASIRGGALLFDRKFSLDMEAALSSDPSVPSSSFIPQNSSSLSYRVKSALFLNVLMTGFEYGRISEKFTYCDEFSGPVSGKSEAKWYATVPLFSERAFLNFNWINSSYDSLDGRAGFLNNAVSGSFSFKGDGSPDASVFYDIVGSSLNGEERSYARYGIKLSKEPRWRAGSIGFKAALSQMSSIGSDSSSSEVNMNSDISASVSALDFLKIEAGMKNERSSSGLNEFYSVKAYISAGMLLYKGMFKPRASAGALFPENRAEGGSLVLTCELPVKAGRFSLSPFASYQASFNMEMQYFSSGMRAAFSF